LFTTGSNKIGSSLSNTQELTGSVGITGSLAVNGAATFASSIAGTSLSISSTTNSTSPSTGAAVISGGMGVNGDIFLHQASANGSNYGYIKTAATTVNTTTLTLGTTYGYGTNVDAVSFFNGSATFNSNVTLTNSVFPVLTVQGTVSSPHIGSTWSVSANQDGIGRTIIGTAGQGRAMYFENNGNILIPNTTLVVGSSVTATQFISSTGYSYPTVNVWTTFYTMASERGIYSVMIGLASESFAEWQAYGVVFCQGSTGVFSTLYNSSLVQMRLSGLNIQVLLATGAGFTRELSFKVLRS
jgi:hypothetical protein